MDWTSWSQNWLTKSTTTTSRRLLKRRRKYLRWRQKYLLLQADQRLKQNQEDLPLLAHLQELYPFVKEHGLILNQELNSIKRIQWQKDWAFFFGTENYLEKKMVRSNSGDWKMIFGTNLSTLNIGWSDDVWKSKMAGGGSNKKRFQYCTDPSGQEILCLRAHSGRNPIDPALQDNVSIQNNFFKYIYHIGCAINLHSITNSGLIAGGQHSSRERQTVFFTDVNPMDKDHKDPYKLYLTKPRLASCTSRRSGKDTKMRCIGSIYSLLNEKDWSSIKQHVTQSSFTIHSQLIVSRKLLRWNLKKSKTRKFMCHLDHHQRFLTKKIGWNNWIQKSLEAAKTPNESNQNQKPNCQERWDPFVGKSPQRKSRKVLCLITRTSSNQQ